MARTRPEDMVIGAPRSNPGRRNNAPITGGRRRRASTFPDILFALATAGFTMALFFVIVSFGDDNVTAGDAGRILARFFAGSLAIAAVMLALLGLILLRDERGQADHYVVPVVLGAAIGIAESFVFLAPAGELLPYPFILLLFALRPVRRAVASLFGLGRRARE